MRTGVAIALCVAAACVEPPSRVAADADPFDECIGDDPADPQLAELMAFARGQLEALEVPGAAIGVVHDGRVDAIATGSKHPLQCDPLTPDSRFFSMFARHITGAAVVAAAAAGELDLDDPITAHLPTFGVAAPGDAAAITLHHLLTNTSGYPVNHVVDCRDVDLVLALQQDLPVWAPPGAVHLELLFDFGLAGNALGDYRAAARRLVVEPLGLTGSFDRLEVVKGDVAIGARRINDGIDPVTISLVECDISLPYLGYFTSARDAAGFLAALLADDSALLAGAENAFYPPERATRGGFVRGPLDGQVDWLYADGRTRGYAYDVRVVPDDGFAVVVFANAGYAEPRAIAERAVEIFTGRKRALELEAQDPADLAALVGRYRQPLSGWTIDVALDGDALSARVNGGDALALAQGTRFGGYVDDLFVLEVGEDEHALRFWRDGDGVGAIISENTFRAGFGPPFFRAP